jgi:hypothetical protein
VALIAGAAPPAFLDDAAEGAIDQVFGILFAVKIELLFKSELEKSGCHARTIRGMGGL